MKLAEEILLKLEEAKGDGKVTIRRKKISIKRKTKPSKKTPQKKIRRPVTAPKKKAAVRKRPGKGKKAGKPVNSLERSTKRLRSKQNRIGSVQLLEINPLSTNKQVIIKSQVFAMTPGAFPYQQTLVFSGVDFVEKKDKEHPLPVTLRNGNLVFAEELNSQTHPMQLRCSCPDFKWTWAWFDAKEKVLVGKRPEPYVRKTPPPPEGLPFRNPIKVPGMCKHLIGVVDKLENNKLLK